MKVRQVIPRDAIPSIDEPTFGTGYKGTVEDEVIVVEFGDQARAYPIRYLNYHEIVNDRLDETPIAVTWCPLCGSAVVYDRRHNGTELEFGVSGKLADDDLVMYDRQTESEWKQSSGQCIAGQYEGDSLSVLPGLLISVEEFWETYPDGVILQPPGGASEAASATDEPEVIEYEAEPYADYFSSEGFGLGAHRGTGGRTWERSDDIEPKTVVLGIENDDAALGFPLPRVLDADGVVQTSVGEQQVVVLATEASGIHAYEDPGFSFEKTDGEFRADGTTWNPATGEAADGRSLARIPARRLFAFAWQDDHGPEQFYDPLEIQ